MTSLDKSKPAYVAPNIIRIGSLEELTLGNTTSLGSDGQAFVNPQGFLIPLAVSK